MGGTPSSGYGVRRGLCDGNSPCARSAGRVHHPRDLSRPRARDRLPCCRTRRGSSSPRVDRESPATLVGIGRSCGARSDVRRSRRTTGSPDSGLGFATSIVGAPALAARVARSIVASSRCSPLLGVVGIVREGRAHLATRGARRRAPCRSPIVALAATTGWLALEALGGPAERRQRSLSRADDVRGISRIASRRASATWRRRSHTTSPSSSGTRSSRRVRCRGARVARRERAPRGRARGARAASARRASIRRRACAPADAFYGALVPARAAARARHQPDEPVARHRRLHARASCSAGRVPTVLHHWRGASPTSPCLAFLVGCAPPLKPRSAASPRRRGARRRPSPGCVAGPSATCPCPRAVAIVVAIDSTRTGRVDAPRRRACRAIRSIRARCSRRPSTGRCRARRSSRRRSSSATGTASRTGGWSAVARSGVAPPLAADARLVASDVLLPLGIAVAWRRSSRFVHGIVRRRARRALPAVVVVPTLDVDRLLHRGGAAARAIPPRRTGCSRAQTAWIALAGGRARRWSRARAPLRRRDRHASCSCRCSPTTRPARVGAAGVRAARARGASRRGRCRAALVVYDPGADDAVLGRAAASARRFANDALASASRATSPPASRSRRVR